MFYRIFFLISCILSLTILQCYTQTITNKQVYKAYTKLWGYVSFFHPSDEVVALQGQKMAYYHCLKLENIKTTNELKDSLTKFFLPIAPSIQFYLKGEKSQNLATYNNKDSLQLVFWQHRGLGLWNFYKKQDVYKSIRINNWQDTIFGNYPKYGEVIEQEIAPNLFCKLPIALYRDKTSTLPRSTHQFTILLKELANLSIDTLSANNITMRRANVVIFWNIINYFYPYFKEAGLNWETQLDILLEDVENPHDAISFWMLLLQSINKLQDAHTFVEPPQNVDFFLTFPFKAKWVGRKYIITQSEDTTYQRGDEIISIANKPIKDFIQESSKKWRGSSYLKNAISGDYFLGWGKPDTKEKIIIRRYINGKVQKMETHVVRNTAFSYNLQTRKPSREIEDGIFYLNFTKDSLEYLKTFVSKLQKAKGVIIEMRGYPRKNNIEFLGYLSPKNLQTALWNIPQIIAPNQKVLTYDTAGRWNIIPKQEQITCKKIFLTNANAQSQAETFMGIVEYYKLGEIIGQPTAGCNGEITVYSLLGGYVFGFTGMKVLKHDGSQHHLIGIKPTVQVTYTEEDVLRGRDADLEKALEILRK